MAIRRARTVEEYVEWVKQAVFETGDLRECLEFELEDLTRFPAFVEPLQQGVENLYRSMQQGEYQFGREDLAFMDIAVRYGDDIPYIQLLKEINETHRKGLDLEGESWIR